MKRIVLALIAIVFLGCFVLISISGGGKSDTPPVEQVTVTYQVLEKVVYSQKVNRGSSISSLYIYENDNHQSYASTWKDGKGNDFTTETIMDVDITIYGELRTSLLLFTTDEMEYTYVNGINHVHQDGKTILLPTYYEKEILIGVGAFTNVLDMKELYLPSTIRHIYRDNFINCPQLTTIYYAGSEEEWNSIPTESELPEDIKLVFNTSF